LTPYASKDAKKKLQSGIKKMEKSLSPESRVFRRMRGGRPHNLGFDKPTPLQVVNRLFNEIERAQKVMREEGVDPKNLSWGIYYYTPATESSAATIHYKHPSRNMKTTTRDAIELLSFFEPFENPIFLGIRWSTAVVVWGEGEDLDTPDWETRFNSYRWNTAAISAALEEEKKK
jgi:hypothetical protein